MEKSSLQIDLRVFPNGYILGLLEKLVHEFQCKHYANYDPNDSAIYIPGLLRRVLEEDLLRIANIRPAQVATFRGYKILPGYEHSRIIISHKHYPDTNNPDLFNSVNVVESVDLEDRPKC